MSEMVERVEQAIADALKEYRAPILRQAARAAIAAMREPSETMIAAVPAGHVDEQREILKKNWASMINAALN